MTHEKVTSWGKASPALKPLVAILNIGLSIEERERARERSKLRLWIQEREGEREEGLELVGYLIVRLTHIGPSGFMTKWGLGPQFTRE